MKTLKFPYAGAGTLYGTVNAYDTEGVLTGAQNITGYGIFFTVKKGFDPGATLLFRKSIGTGVTITTGSTGLFSVTFNSQDLRYNPADYIYGLSISSAGTTFSETGSTTTDLRSIGSGVFRIMQGVRYGTSVA